MHITKRITYIISLMALLVMFMSTRIEAQESCVDNGGCGYNECCRSTTLAPAIALGTILVVGMVAVAVQNTSGHGHCHSHD